MLPKFSLILATPPPSASAASVYGLPLAHMAYRVGGGPHLFRANLPLTARGGILVMDGAGFDGRGEAAPFCHEVMRECACRGFDGVLCDFDEPPIPLLGQIVSYLGGLLAKRGFPLFVPEAYARFSKEVCVLIPSALSGGSLAVRLQEAVAEHGAERLVLALERVREDFYLPSPSGGGRKLTAEELDLCIRQRTPSVFFSSELCAHYFTYATRGEGTHFVLFDDGASLRKKLQVAQGLGIRRALVAYPEVADVIGELLR